MLKRARLLLLVFTLQQVLCIAQNGRKSFFYCKELNFHILITSTSWLTVALQVFDCLLTILSPAGYIAQQFTSMGLQMISLS